ncbi:DEAD/DEAH box helicase [Polycladidibacter stylochi]|uniref:DEAD/DEAH box helicase n=1 Tax=Polycladidibacter stylochi TaxID=1807766 RepID=UPI00082AF144|nr:DEAD/DEAH box helicase [Pseudovibrio stylochi]
MTNFTSLGISRPLILALEAKNYSLPTPIQTQAIPIILEGNDLVGLAQTGTGKTAAFGLPLLQRLHESNVRPAPRSIRSLVLAPTRELAEQITKNLKEYSKRLNMHVASSVGGVPIGPQIRALQRGLDVLVATPGRLLDLCTRNAVNFEELEIFVIDEADQMLDLGFLAELEEIAYQLPVERQSLFFSATMPKEIEQLAKRFLTKPKRVAANPPATTVEKADQLIAHVRAEQKFPLLKDLLNRDHVTKALIFTLTKRGAAILCRKLQADSIAAAVIHGDMSQVERNKTLEQFRRGHLAYLVATDVAARGIDVQDISHVINYDMPNVAENYVHRIGRTARAGMSGQAISFCLPEERGMLQQIQSLIRKKIAEHPDYAYFKSAQEPKSLRKTGSFSKRPQVKKTRTDNSGPSKKPAKGNKNANKKAMIAKSTKATNAPATTPSSPNANGYLRRKKTT